MIEGKSIVGISLPVKIFEPRSTIERICDNWVYLPIYLGLAGQTTVKYKNYLAIHLKLLINLKKIYNYNIFQIIYIYNFIF